VSCSDWFVFCWLTVLDCLTSHISSASADFILPTLIYTLIISPPTPDFNVTSNLYFIQRFRSSRAIDGEAAYCLTNLEAAMSFLETVDLASLNMKEGDSVSEKEPLRKSTAASTLSPPKHFGSSPSASSSTTSLQLAEANRPRKPSFLAPIDIAVSTADQDFVELAIH